jgi:hypothetical protein
MWVTHDLGLPALGIDLFGRLRVADGKAEVSVFAPLSAAVPEVALPSVARSGTSTKGNTATHRNEGIVGALFCIDPL